MNLSTHKFTEGELVKLDRDDLISYITNIFRKEYAKLRQNIVEKYNVMQLTILERNIILEIFDQA
ncbi:preprotein translocase subunit SecA [Chlamydia abortus]|nr:preprotein translocase subunit SecA [Chlamydia abortus]